MTTKATIQEYLDKRYGEGTQRVLTEPVHHYGEWVALVVIGADGPLVRMAFSCRPVQLELFA